MQWWMMKRRLHTSWLIAFASGMFLVGVMLAEYVDPTLFVSVSWCLSACVLIVFVLWRRRLYLVLLLVVAAGLLGLWRGSVEQAQLTVYEKLYGSTVILGGIVGEDADIGKGGGLVLRLNQVHIADQPVAGKLWVNTASKADIKRGDYVEVRAVLDEGFGSFAGATYRAEIRKVQRPEPGDIARQIRDWFADAVRLTIAEPQASLGIGYLTGQRRALPEELSQALQITGLTHIVVASGYNLTILVRLARRLFEKVSKYLSVLFAGTLILAFVAVTGASPSMTRAGLVAGLGLAVWYYGRTVHPFVLLPFAAAVTVMIDPGFMWGDLGWQLSFAAFAGVMIVAPLGQAYFFGNKKPGTIRQILGETISAQLMTLPILILAFGQFSNVAIVANLLVLPLVPLAMLLTFTAGIGALVLPGLASVIGVPAQWLLAYMTTVIEYLSKLPWAQAELEINGWIVGLAYIAIVSGCIYMWRATKLDLRGTNVVE